MHINFSAHCAIPRGDLENWLTSTPQEEIAAIALDAACMRATREICPSLPITMAEVAEAFMLGFEAASIFTSINAEND